MEVRPATRSGRLDTFEAYTFWPDTFWPGAGSPATRARCRPGYPGPVPDAGYRAGRFSVSSPRKPSKNHTTDPRDQKTIEKKFTKNDKNYHFLFGPAGPEKFVLRAKRTRLCALKSPPIIWESKKNFDFWVSGPARLARPTSTEFFQWH